MIAPALLAAALAVAAFERPPLVAAVPAPDGTPWERCLLLLEGRPETDDPPQVTALCAGAAGTAAAGTAAFTPLAAAPAHCRAIAAEKTAAGGLRVLAGRPSGVEALEFATRDGAPQRRALIDDERLDPETLALTADSDGDGTPDQLLQYTYAGLAAWRRAPDGGAVALGTARLAPEAVVGADVARVRGAFGVGQTPAGPVQWTWPEALPGQRLRTWRVPLGASGPGAPCPAWVQTPLPVYVQNGVFLGGDPPRLAALVAPSEKVAIFGNTTLLVAPLACDDTARGKPPEVFEKTGFDANIGWVGFEARDVSGDGTLDLVLCGRQGAVDHKLKLAVYRGTGAGRFESRPREFTDGRLDPLAVRLGSDVDGDGTADLVVLEKNRVIALAGRPAKDVPFDASVRHTVALPEGLAAEEILAVVDLDRDGRAEAVVLARPEHDPRRARVNVSGGGAAPRPEARIVVIRFP